MINDRLILMRENHWREIINGEINDQNTYYQTLDGASETFNIEYYNERSIRTDNNEVYVNASVAGVGYKIYRFDVANNNLVSLNYTQNENVLTNNGRWFAFDAAENLLVSNQNSDNTTAVYSYQLAPEIKILAGATIGTVTFTGSIDTLNEAEETIIVTPGAVSNGTLTDSSAITATIVDINDPSVVTFTFTSDSVIEGSAAVTLTATAELVSELDITIPFTIAESSTASADGYTVSATEIVITAGSTTGSVTVTAVDDDAVEVLETIVFTIGELVNGSTETTELSLNLESDDDSIVTSIAFAPTSFDEDASTVLTATIDAPSSRDLSFPLTLSGTATTEDDYTTTFPSQGEETLKMIINENNNSYQNFSYYEGKYIFVDGSYIMVSDPIAQTTSQYNFQNYIGGSKKVINGDYLYYHYDNSIKKIDISNFTNISTAEPTEIYSTSSSALGIGGGFAVIDGTIYYQTYQNITGTWRVYSLVEGEDPVLIDVNNSFSGFFKINNTLYSFNSNNIYEYVNGEFNTESPIYSNIGIYQSTYLVNNGTLYVRDQQTSPNYIFKANFNANNLEFNQLNYSLASDTNSVQGFDFDSTTGGLLLYNQSTEGVFSVFSYQINLEINIPSGATTGTVTFTAATDILDEADETITVTPGDVSNGTLSDSSAITATIVDINDPSAVTFAFSSDSVTEGSAAVTLTASIGLVSDLDITIPFIIAESSTASADGYTVSATEIVITAGSTTGSVTVTAVDDDAVEVLETIVFTIGELVNGSTETTELSLNLNSDDDSTVTSIVADPTSFAEDASTTVTATIDAASSRDLSISVTLSGTAIADVDFTTTFDSDASESLLSAINGSHEYFDVLADGRSVLLQGNKITVYNPVSGESTSAILSRSYDYLQVSGNTIYSQTSYYDGSTNLYENVINSIDVSDLNDIVETPEVVLGPNVNFEKEFSVEGNNILYNTYDTNNEIYNLYKKSGSSPAELVISFTNSSSSYLWGLQPVLVNDRVYMIQLYNEVYEVVNQEFISQPQMLNAQGNYLSIEQGKINVINGKVYAKFTVDGSGGYKVHEINLETGIGQQLTYNLGSQIGSIKDFSLSSAGNLILFNSENDGIYGLYSYQLTPEIKVPAGQVTGTITFTGALDTLDEAEETIIVTPGDVSNGTLSDSSAITATIVDINDPSAVTFAFSSDSVTEGSAAVTLTASIGLVSDLDITIPFIIAESSTASADGYTVSATE
ncbi:MAG: beta strand repeat-containing protein, partial [Methylophagaceae bacterium]